MFGSGGRTRRRICSGTNPAPFEAPRSSSDNCSGVKKKQSRTTKARGSKRKAGEVIKNAVSGEAGAAGAEAEPEVDERQQRQKRLENLARLNEQLFSSVLSPQETKTRQQRRQRAMRLSSGGSAGGRLGQESEGVWDDEPGRDGASSSGYNEGQRKTRRESMNEKKKPKVSLLEELSLL